MDYDFMPKNGMCTRKIEKQMVRNGGNTYRPKDQTTGITQNLH